MHTARAAERRGRMDLDEMMQRQAARLEKRSDPEPATEQPRPPAIDTTGATPGNYRLAISWTCAACGAERSLLDENAITAALGGARMLLVCGADVPGDGSEPTKCGHKTLAAPAFSMAAKPSPNQAMNRKELRALQSARRRT